MSELPNSDVQKLSVEQIYSAHKKSLSHIQESIYKVPSIFSSIIGGLWYFAAQHLNDKTPITLLVFFFAAGCGWASIIALKNLGFYQNKYLDIVVPLEGDLKVTSKVPNQSGGNDSTRLSILKAMIKLMYAATWLSIAGGAYGLAAYLLSFSTVSEFLSFLLMKI